ncbi:hypothetical protein F5X96DRAFT_621672 [Biscogniauxia mediterranea]|nr:hypothetical protein F5X96DRAFT_621672 [Biscogniauxia mediterranea]
MAYDAYIDQFKWLVDEATTKLATLDDRNSSSSRLVVFSFEMAFVPSLFFIAIKCRCLDTRLRARRGSGLGGRRCGKSLTFVYATGKLIIELEHGVSCWMRRAICAPRRAVRACRRMRRRCGKSLRVPSSR